MSKTIKLDQEVYQELNKLRRKEETFSQSVSRLLRIYKFLERMFFLFKSQEKPKG